MNREFKNLTQMKEWVNKEMDVALQKELPDDVLEDYVGAQMSFNLATESSKNPEHVLEVLKMILDGHLLSPIEDKEEEFTKKGDIYQAKRWPYLHYIWNNHEEKKTIIDTRSALTVDIHNPREYLFEPFAISYFYRECHRLEFPYMPPKEPWVIYVERCNSSGNKEVKYDTLGICYAKLPDQNQLMEITKYFKKNPIDNVWHEIDISEYAFRCKKGGLLDE